MSAVARPRRRLRGRVDRSPTICIGRGGLLGVFNLLVEDGPSDAAALVTILIPFAPAAASLRHLAPGTPVEVLGRATPEVSAGPTIHVVRAERVTVLISSAVA